MRMPNGRESVSHIRRICRILQDKIIQTRRKKKKKISRDAPKTILSMENKSIFKDSNYYIIFFWNLSAKCHTFFLNH